MSEEPNWVISLIVAFLPYATFCVIGWWLGHQIRRGFRTKDGRSVADVLDELSRELKRSSATIEALERD